MQTDGSNTTFDERMARVHDPAYALRSWVYLLHPFLVLMAASGIAMRIRRARPSARSTLKAFWRDEPQFRDAEGPTLAWYWDVVKADWAKPSDVKRQFGSASILKDGRVVFNIAGNKYRIVVWINYPYRVVHIRFIGIHEQYDEIDAQAV